MHYYIDGYNLLFRLNQDCHDDLQNQRELLVQDMNKKISVLNLNATIVFDSLNQNAEGKRSHYNQLEIIFTEGETADEYILDELKHCKKPHLETVVTSDNRLAWRARNRSAVTKSVEEFISWLNKAYKNKLRLLKKDSFNVVSASNSVKQTEVDISSQLQKPLLVPPKDAPIEAYDDYYAQIFETRWQEVLKNEEMVRSLKEDKKLKKSTKKKKEGIQMDSVVKDPKSEMERWLTLFEKNFNDEKM